MKATMSSYNKYEIVRLELCCLLYGGAIYRFYQIDAIAFLVVTSP
jgi:hypothetical protein